jgi:hypothetical protein
MEGANGTNRGGNLPRDDNCKSKALPQRKTDAKADLIARRGSLVCAAISDVLQQLRLYRQWGMLLQHWAGHEHL